MTTFAYDYALVKTCEASPLWSQMTQVTGKKKQGEQGEQGLQPPILLPGYLLPWININILLGQARG